MKTQFYILTNVSTRIGVLLSEYLFLKMYESESEFLHNLVVVQP